MGRAWGSMENLREYGRVWMVGEWGNFGQIEKLGQVWGKYERNWEVCWDVGGKRKCGKMCLGCEERCGKCVGVGGRGGKCGRGV